MLSSYKIFVRESTSHPEFIVDKHRGELIFCGDEAKKAYDDIVINTYSEDPTKIPKNFQRHPEQLRISVRKKLEKPRQCQQVIIPVNAILKSIEEGNWNFIKQNITRENVNIVDSFGWTPLMSAAYNGNIEIVKYLLILGADKSLKDKSGLDALQLARKRNHNGIISLLEREKLEIIDNHEKHSPNHVKLSSLYCSVCKANFQETTAMKHESSLLHIFNTNPKLPDPIYGIPKANKGYQLMLNIGWEESKGLGPSGSGLKYPVKTILKRDRKGLGGGGGPSEARPRVTHFKSNDVNAIRHVRQERVMKEKTFRKKDREKFLSREARKERAIRRALS